MSKLKWPLILNWYIALANAFIHARTHVTPSCLQVRARKRAGALETQLQECHDAKAALEADIRQLQALPAQIRDLEVLCARKERELSLLQVQPPAVDAPTARTASHVSSCHMGGTH